MPPVIVAAAAYAAASAATAAAVAAGIVVAEGLGAALIFAATSLAVSYLGNSLIAGAESSNISMSEYGQGILLNKASNTEQIPVVYGSRRVGGARVFLAVSDAPEAGEWIESGYWTTPNGEEDPIWVDTSHYDGTMKACTNGYLHIVQVLCEGPIGAINEVFFNDVDSTDPKFDGWATIHKHLGEDDQEADADLMAACPEWTSDHRLRGVAYLYIRLRWNLTAFPTGLPVITANVDGKTVYDPRDESTAYSHNPVINTRDYLTNARYGRGIPAALIPDADIIASANYCDELVLVGGVNQARYTCDGVVNVDNSALANVNQLLSSCRGMLIFSGGLYRLLIDKPEVSTFDFTEDNITGSWEIPLGTKRNMFNRIRAKFFNPEKSWQEDIAPVESAELRALDNGLLLETEISLPFTANANTVKQITTIEINQSRQQLACRFTAFVEGMRCEVGDVVTITHSTPGWVAKKFRALNIALKNDDEVTVTAREYAETVYDFGTILAYDTAPNTTLPALSAIAPPRNIEAQEEFYNTGQDLLFRVILTWDPPPDTFAESYESAYKLSAATEWTFVTHSKVRSVAISHLAGGDYDFRVRAINTLGVPSAWATISQNIDGLPENPAAPDSFTATLVGATIELAWTVSQDVAVKGYTVYLGELAIVTNTSGDKFTYRGPLTAGEYNFTLVCVDAYGQESEPIAATGITIEAPDTPVVSHATNSETVALSWQDCKTSLDIDYYTVNGFKVILPEYSEAVAWASKEFSVIAIDVAGNASASATFTVIAPATGESATGAVTDIATVGRAHAIQLFLTFGTFTEFQAVEIHASATNNFAAAAYVGETTSSVFSHTGLDLIATRYYWTRIRKKDLTYGAWYPLSTNAGVSGTTSTDPGAYLGPILTDESGLTQTLRDRIAWIDQGGFVFGGSYVTPDTVIGMNGVFNTLAALGTDHDTRISSAEIEIDEGIAGDWASITNKVTTIAYDADQKVGGVLRISTAEQDIVAGKAGEWAGIQSKVSTIRYEGDQYTGGVLRISTAESDILAGKAGEWAGIVDKVLTSRYDADQIDPETSTLRISLAENDLLAGKAGTWASFDTKLAVATYNTDTKDGNGYSRIIALENRFDVYDTADADTWTSGVPYDPGTIVIRSGLCYRCKKVALNIEPEVTDGWSLYWFKIEAGMLSRWTLKVQANGYVAGVGLSIDGSGGSAFVIESDNFKIVKPNFEGTPTAVFGVDAVTGNVGIDGNLIISGSLLADKIGAGTITSKTITLAYQSGSGNAQICAGKTDFSNDAMYGAGFCFGIHHADGLAKLYMGNDIQYINWTGTALVVGGDIITTGNIKTQNITSPLIKDYAVSQTWFGTATGTCSSGSITWLGGNVHITVTSGALALENRTFTLKRDGTTIYTDTMWAYIYAVTFVDQDVTAGAHTYTAELSGSTNELNMAILDIIK